MAAITVKNAINFILFIFFVNKFMFPYFCKNTKIDGSFAGHFRFDDLSF